MLVAASAAALAVDGVLAGKDLAAGNDFAAGMEAADGGNGLDLDGHGGVAVGEHHGLDERVGLGLGRGAGQSGEDDGELDDPRGMHYW